MTDATIFLWYHTFESPWFPCFTAAPSGALSSFLALFIPKTSEQNDYPLKSMLNIRVGTSNRTRFRISWTTGVRNTLRNRSQLSNTEKNFTVCFFLSIKPWVRRLLLYELTMMVDNLVNVSDDSNNIYLIFQCCTSQPDSGQRSRQRGHLKLSFCIRSQVQWMQEHNL